MFLNDFLNLSGTGHRFAWNLHKVKRDLTVWFDDDVRGEHADVVTRCQQYVAQQLASVIDAQSPNQKTTNAINDRIRAAIFEWLYKKGEFSERKLILAAEQLSEKNPACEFLLDILQHPDDYAAAVFPCAQDMIRHWIYANHLMKRFDVVSQKQFEYSEASGSYALQDKPVSAAQAALFHNKMVREFGNFALSVCQFYVQLDQEKDLEALTDKLQAVLTSMAITVDNDTILHHLRKATAVVKTERKTLQQLISDQQTILTECKYQLYCLEYLKQSTLVFPASLEKVECQGEIERDIASLQAQRAEVEEKIGECLQSILATLIPEPDVVRQVSGLLQDVRVRSKETLLESLKRMYHMNKSSVFSSIFSLTSYAGSMGLGAVAFSFFAPVLALPAAAIGAGLGLGFAGLVQKAATTAAGLLHDWQMFKQNEIEQLYTLESSAFAVTELFGADGGTNKRAKQQALQTFFINHLKQLHIAMEGGAKDKDIEAAHQLLFYYWKEIKGEYGGKKSEAEIMRFFERAMSVVAALKLDAYYGDTAKLCTTVLTGHDLQVEQVEAKKKLEAIQSQADVAKGKKQKTLALTQVTPRLAIQDGETEHEQYETGGRAIVPMMAGAARSLAVRAEPSALAVQIAQVENKLALVSGDLERSRADQSRRQFAIAQHQQDLESLLVDLRAVQRGEMRPLWTIDPFDAIARGDRYQLRHWLEVAKTRVRDGRFSEIAGLKDEAGISLLQKAIDTKNSDALSTLIDVIKRTGINSANRVEQAAASFAWVAAQTGLLTDTENLTLGDFFDLSVRNAKGKGLIECILDIEDAAVRQLMMQDFLAEIRRSSAKMTEKDFDVLFDFLGTAIPRESKGTLSTTTTTVMSWLGKKSLAIVSPIEIEQACRLSLLCAEDPKQVDRIMSSSYDMVDVDAYAVASCIVYRVQFFQKLAVDRQAGKLRVLPEALQLLECIYMDDQRGLQSILEKGPREIGRLLADLEKNGFDLFRIALDSGSARFLETLLDNESIRIDVRKYPDLLIRFAEMKRFDLVMKYWQHEVFGRELDIDRVHKLKSVLSFLVAQGNAEALDVLFAALTSRGLDLKIVFHKSLEDYQGIVEPVYNLWTNRKKGLEKELNLDCLQRLLVCCDPTSEASVGIRAMIDYVQVLEKGDVSEIEKFLVPHKKQVEDRLALAMAESFEAASTGQPFALTHQADAAQLSDSEDEDEMYKSCIDTPPMPQNTKKL